MTRSMHLIDCHDDRMACTLDMGTASTGLLIVSGGNEIRSGAHGGMADLASKLAKNGYPVLRFDRRGTGDSSGENRGFLQSREDISAAASFLRQRGPGIKKILAFGNCDAATALALFQTDLKFDGLCLANPWIIEQAGPTEGGPSEPSAAAVRSRYWQRLKNPGTYSDLLKGRINFRKLLKGLRKAGSIEKNSNLALELRDSLHGLETPVDLLMAERDTTALAFLGAWKSSDYAEVRRNTNLKVHGVNTASHGFADEASKMWLESRLLETLGRL